MPQELLDRNEIEAALAQLPGWALSRDGKSIRCQFKFASFVQAFGWMSQVALMAEKLNHHPDWSNSYRRVQVSLSTLDSGGVTALDFTLARQMTALAAL